MEVCNISGIILTVWVIATLIPYATTEENRTDAVDIHVCAFQPPKPSASCQDCLPALVSGSADEVYTIDVGLWTTNGNKFDEGVLSECSVADNSPSGLNLSEPISFSFENDPALNFCTEGTELVCKSLNLPPQNDTFECTIYSRPGAFVTEEQNATLCITSAENIQYPITLSVYPLFTYFSRHLLGYYDVFEEYFVVTQGAVSSPITFSKENDYCNTFSIQEGLFPEDNIYAFALTADTGIHSSFSSCSFLVQSLTSSTWKSCPKEWSLAYCLGDFSGSVNSTGCILLEYRNIIKARTMTFIYFLVAPLELAAYHLFFQVFTEVTHSSTISDSAMSSSCTTNCTVLVIFCDETICQNYIISLLSDVPQQFANSLMKKFPIVKVFDEEVNSNIMLHLSCCNISCNKDFNFTQVIIGTTIGAVLLILVITAILLCIGLCCLRSFYRSRMKTTVEQLEQNTCKNAISYSNPNYRPELGSQIELPRMICSGSGSGDHTYSTWSDIFVGKTINYNQLELQELLGEGEYGKVYIGRVASLDIDTSTSYYTEVAIKTLKRENATQQEVDDFIAESVIMVDFDHPNVMRLMGVCLDADDGLPLIVLPYMENGDLRSFLKEKRLNNTQTGNVETDLPEDLSQEILKRMCLDVAKGMEYLSNSKFIHRDLAARNCMVNSDLRVLVSDFGLSRDVYYSDYYRLTHSARLPIKWMAPESLRDRIYNESTDIWAFGVVCWEVFSLGCLPYPGVDNADVLDYISKGNRPIRPPLCPKYMYRVMMHTWIAAPDKRPVFSQILSSLEGKRDLDADHQYFVLGEDSVLPEGSHPAAGMARTGIEMSNPLAHTTKSHTILGTSCPY